MRPVPANHCKNVSKGIGSVVRGETSGTMYEMVAGDAIIWLYSLCYRAVDIGYHNLHVVIPEK
jgi:hypothetical protein